MQHRSASHSEPGMLSRTARSWPWAGIGLVIFILCGLYPAQAQNASEYAVKAAYLYNFAKSAEWPENSLANSAPLVIGVVAGDDEFIDTLRRTVAGRTAGMHAITIKRADSIADMDFCHMLFFRSSAGRKRTEAAIVALASASILLVGEDESFLRQGGMINLVLKNGTVRFEVDLAAVERANLHLSPELLALAFGTTDPEPSKGTTEESRRLRVSTPPEYPELARKMSIKGVAQVELSVDRDGTVKGVKIIGGHPLLAEALVKAVMGWQYEPAAKDSRIVVRFVFEP
jgi:TonB family protein